MLFPGQLFYREIKKKLPLGEVAHFLVLFWQLDMSAVGQSAVYSAADLAARACSGHLHSEDVYDKMDPGLPVRLCVIDGALQRIRNCCNNLRNVLFNRGIGMAD